MLVLVGTKSQKLEKYRSLTSKELFSQIQALAKDLKGLRVFHVNSTPRGGGVAEVLKSLVPLMRGVGLQAEWYTIPLQESFFQTTKRLHNALQGKDFHFKQSQQKKYQRYLKRTARLLEDMKADIWVIHDPQPMGIISYLPSHSSFISRLHIDTSEPNPEAWQFISSFLKNYDRIIFSSKKFVRPGVPKDKVVVFPPAIDPLAAKNQPLSLTGARQILKNFGINPEQPLISQVSRFDHWKDPLGVIKAFRLAKSKIPNLQLALVGFFLARDDPEAEGIYEIAKKEAAKETNIFLFANCELLGSLKVDTFVNAIQVGSDVILQKSIKEGFGLCLAEAMWKQKPVIGGSAEGIKLQINDGQNGFLVSTPREAAQRIVELIKNKKLAKKMAEKAKTTVQKKFLIPRLLRDYLRLFQELTFKSS